MKLFLYAGIACLPLLFAACGGGDHPGTESSPAASAASKRERALAVANNTVFSDSFSRSDSAVLGQSETGAAWTESNELYTPVPGGAARQFTTVHPTWIELQASSLTFRYADPQTPSSHAQPYAYAKFTRATSAVTMNFTFTPAPTGGRVSHVVGVMSSAEGFWSAIPATDYGAYRPVRGLGIAVGRSDFRFLNSSLSLLKFNGVGGVENLGDRFLPFQYDAGVSYRFSVAIADGAVAIDVSSSRGEHVSYSYLIPGFAPEVDQLVVLDEQAGHDGLKFDSISVTAPVTYSFTGFFSPVNNLPVVNRANAGSAIPVKFSLSGDQGLDIFATSSPASQAVSCGSGAPTDVIEETVTAGSSTLSYDATTDQYTYVWKTDKAWGGTCRRLLVTLKDGVTREASFEFAK